MDHVVDPLLDARVVVRVYVWEEDKYQGAPLYQAVAEMLRRHGVAGATVTRALMGFGPRAAHVPAGDGSLLGHVPIIIECVDTDERLRCVVPDIQRMLVGGLITLEPVQGVLRRPGGGTARRQ